MRRLQQPQVAFVSVAACVAEGLWGKDKKMKAEFRELINGEWEVARAIIRGHAISEHMEDKYHNMLKVFSWNYGSLLLSSSR